MSEQDKQERALAEVRKKMAQAGRKCPECFGVGTFFKGCVGSPCYKCSGTGVIVDVDKILSLPIPIGGGVCPECKGRGGYYFILPDEVGSPNLISCHICNGTGKLPVEEKTIKECIEEAIGSG